MKFDLIHLAFWLADRRTHPAAAFGLAALGAFASVNASVWQPLALRFRSQPWLWALSSDALRLLNGVAIARSGP